MTDRKNALTFAGIVRMLFVAGIACFLPLLVSGRWDWWEGWVFAFLFMGNFIVSRVLLFRSNPDLAAERERSMKKEDTKSWDKVLAPLMALGGVLISVTAGLDVRFGGSPVFSFPLQIVALLLILAGLLLGTRALLANRFFSGVVRIQSDRGHTVESGGPYRHVRHPGYAAALLSFIAIPVFLNSLWALLPAALMGVISILRTSLEDRTLQEELEGYREYAQRVRYRLVPGVW